MDEKTAAASELPSYDHSRTVPIMDSDSKTHTKHESCDEHATPVLDSYLRRPTIKAAIQSLALSLTDLVDEEKCSHCALETGSKSVVAIAKDAKAAKKDQKLAKEDKKALKRELKGLGHGLKASMKKTWKGKD